MSDLFACISAATIRNHSARKLGAACSVAVMMTMLPAAVGQQTPGLQQAEIQAAKAPASRPKGTTTPLSFVRNAGQDPTGAQFLAHGPGYAMRLSAGSVELSLRRGVKSGGGAAANGTVRLGMGFLGANPQAMIETAEPLAGTESYFIGPDQKNWRTGLPTYGTLRYREIYPGTDLAFHGSGAGPEGMTNDGSRLEYDIELRPHADPRTIAIELKDAERAEIDRDGNLQLSVGGAPLRFLKPVAWQGPRDGAARRPIEVSYRLKPAKNGSPAVLSFETGKYDHEQALVIDPVLDYATYLDLYSETAMTVDAAGNVYVTGQDPTNTTTAFDVIKFNSAGTLVYTAVVQDAAGTGYGYSDAIAVDASGEAYIAGFAGYGWPTTSTAYQTTNGYASQSNPYYYNAYLVKLNAAGSAMVYATYLGGSNSPSVYTDYAVALALDSSGNAYMAGTAESPNFPTTAGAFQTAFPAVGNSATGFVAKINPSLSGTNSLVYSTLFGDQNAFEIGIAVDSSGNAYISGVASNQYNSTLAATPGAFAYNGLGSGQGAGAYVTKLNATGSALAYSAYIGNGTATGIAVDGSGDAYVTGYLGIEDFPTTGGAYETSYPGGFVTELNPAGTAEIYSTFLSGPSGVQYPTYISPRTIALTPGCASACAAYIAGFSQATDLPQINSVQTAPGTSASLNGFLVALNGTGSAATLSTYIGGLSSSATQPSQPLENGLWGFPSVAVDGSGNIYYSADISNPDFPVTTATPAVGGYYPYLAKIGPATGAQIVALPTNTTVNLSNSVIGTSSAVYNGGSPTVTLRNVGSAAATITSITPSSSVFGQTNTCGGTIAAGGQCTLTPAFTPTADGTVNGTLTIASNSVSSPATISLTGNGIDGGYLQTATTALNFGTQTVGTASAFQTFTLKNTGDQAVTGITLNYLPAGFNALNNCPSSLAAGQSCQFGIQFAPYEAGYVVGGYGGSIYLYASSSANNIPVALSGTGVVSGDTGALTLNPTALNFNTLAVGTASTNQYVTIANTGTEPVTVNSYTAALTGSSGSVADFAITPNGCGVPPIVIQPQSTCSLYVTFTPSVAAAETATLSIANSSGHTPTVAMSGTGTADTPTLVFTPSNFVFPDQTVGTTGTNQYFYATNIGDDPVTIDRVYATGDFKLYSAGCADTTLTPSIDPGLPGADCTVVVAFAPTATGNRTGSIVFIDNAGGTQTLPLTGNGTVASGSILADPPTVLFGPQAVGVTSGDSVFTLSNPGNVPVTVNSITTTGDYSFAGGYSNNCSSTLPCLMPAGSAYTYTGYLTFTPTATGTRTGTMTINSTAGAQTVAITGTGETASVAVGLTPAVGSTLSFGNVQSGSDNSVGVFLRNVGTEAVTFTSNPTVTGNYYTYPNNYFSNQCGVVVATLQPETSCEIYIEFLPTTTGVQTGVLTITDSAGTQTLNLTGTGTAAAPVTYFGQPALVFPQTPVGTSSSTPYSPTAGSQQYFYYTGTGSLTIASASVTAGGSFYNIPLFGDNCTGATISSGGGCNFQVNFSPTAAGYDTGTVTLTDTNGGTYTLPLYGYSPVIDDSGSYYPDGLAFVSQSVGTISSYQTISLGDYGSTNMTLGTVGGSNIGPGSEFQIQSDGCSGTTLTAAGGSGPYCNVNIEFAPSATGARSGQISIPVTYSDGTAATLTANLNGTGGADNNKAVLTPTTGQLPELPIGQVNNSNYQPFTLYNVGNLPFYVGQLTGTNAVVGTSHSGDFTTSDSCSGVTVAAGGTCTVNVYFAPLAGATGTRTGSITFPVLYSGASTVTSFTGTVTANAVTAAKGLAVSPSNAQLGTWTVGTTSSSTTITLSNTGNAPVSLGTPTIGAPFGLQNNCSSTLAAATTCTIYVAFRPTAAGAVTGTLSIPNGAGATQTVPIYGTGLAASQELVWSQGTVAFGNHVEGTTSNQVTLSLLNQGSASVLVKNVTLAGTNPTDFVLLNAIACIGTTLTSGTSCSIAVEFQPGSTAAGALSATVTETDGGSGGPRSVSLTGTGTTPAPAVGLFPSPMVYGPQNIGTRSNGQVLSVTNTGTATLTVTSVASTGSSEYSISSNGCAGSGGSLAAGADCLVAVVFTPTSSGSHSGTITVTDNASGSPQTVALTAQVPRAALSVSSLTFTSQNVGSSSTAQTATLTNSGTGALSIASIAIGGADPSDFTSTNTCGSSLAAGGSCIVSVTFTPTAGGARTASLVVTDNAALAAGSAQTISLSGTGVPLAATPTFTPAAGTYPSTQSVTIADATSGSTIYYTTNGSTPTTSSAVYSTAIPVAASETIKAIAVASGYANSSVASASYVIQPPAPAASISPTSYTFANTAVGHTSGYAVFTLTNTGNATLTISSITSTGTNASSFTIPSNHQLCTSVAAGANCTFDVAFTPTAVGTLSATIQIADNATGSPQSVAVSGTGTGAAVSLSPTSFTFATTPVGTTSAYEVFTITNTGNASLTVSSIASTGTNASSFTVPSSKQLCTTVAAGANCTFDVAFTPTTAGSLSASIQIADTATGSPQSVAVSGTGSAPAVSVSPTSFTFANTPVGHTAAYEVFTLTNTGNAPLTVSSITSTGTNASSFTVPSNHQLCTTVAAGATCTFDVAFTPTAVGTLSATIQISDTAAGSPQSIPVSGTGH